LLDDRRENGYAFTAMAKRNTQQSFKDPLLKKSHAFGGELLKKAKNRHARPLSTKAPMHLCLRSSAATQEWSFRSARNWRKVENLCRHFARKNGVRVLELANSGNHLHLLIKLSNRRAYSRFVKGLTGALAMAVTGASKNNKLKAKFWDHRPFTRIVEGLRNFLTARDYVRLNKMEAIGVIPYQPGRLKTVDRGLLRKWADTA
jgi:REP element-mobilizing transposase RayT